MATPSAVENAVQRIVLSLLVVGCGGLVGKVLSQDNRLVAIESNRHTQLERAVDRKDVDLIRRETEDKLTRILVTIERIDTRLSAVPESFLPATYEGDIDRRLEAFNTRLRALEREK